MTTLQDLRRTIGHFADRTRKRMQLRRELEQLEALGSLDAVLADAGIVRSQIEPLITGCAGSRDLLDKMLARLGIDAAQLPVESLRDMTWTCTTCPDKRKCRKWLAGIEEADFHAFCPNAEQLDHAMAAAAPAGCSYRAAPTGGPNDDAFHPSADELRRLRAEASRRETRALLDSARLL
jgi:uncharacterized protein YjiS (DUF1127 family)